MADVEAKKLARRLKRRVYIRKMMRHYRDKEKRDFVSLRAQALALEVELRHLASSTDKANPRGALPWKEVALALLGERQVSHREKDFLVHQLDHVSAVVRTMSQWVATHSMPLSMCPCDDPTSTWRQVTLMADPESRALAKEWLLQQMYGHTDHMFRTFGFPTLDGQHTFQRIDVTFHDDDDDRGFVYVAGYQFQSGDASIERVLRTFRQHLCCALAVNGRRPIRLATTVVEASDTTSLHQMVTDHGQAVNLLCGQFVVDANRGVLVAHEIKYDESWPHDLPRRQRMLWFERVHVGDKHVVRMLIMSTQPQHRDGRFVPLEQHAMDFNVDLRACPTEETKAASFRHGVIAFGEWSFAQARSRFQHITDE
ncbi:Aste57867_14635 [Aphanomyces stellatus]|uniref:Aste57867_14635 protein n=1 Tax=Aphanomyces stellatus TaxID=120398 RepID=A0A485L163_9STRA|nr:hypothetical protein As57867_014580 [Aphanomyces stellatus]VFT91454.1 Aste57867_14635 [Aphanomyces stellatus]